MIPNQNSTNLRLDQIILDKKIQPRAIIQKQVIIDYCDSYLQGDKFPNLTVFFDGDKYWLVDGWHRYYAVKLAKFSEVGCDVINRTFRDALRFMLSSVNKKQGKNFSLKDKRKIVMRFVNDPETSHMNAREINRENGISMYDINNILIKIIEQKVEKEKAVL